MRTIRELDLQPRIPADRAVLNKEVQNECTNEAMDEIKTPKVRDGLDVCPCFADLYMTV